MCVLNKTFEVIMMLPNPQTSMGHMWPPAWKLLSPISPGDAAPSEKGLSFAP